MLPNKKLDWKKIPSVTTGGKPYFYRAYDPCGRWLASVIWNRGVLAYAVEVAPATLAPAVLVGYVSTPRKGKSLACKSLKGKTSPVVVDPLKP